MARQRVFPVAIAGVVAALSSASCSWGRFDDVVLNPPVELLNRPGFMKGGFGAVMASARVGKGASLLAGGEALSSPAGIWSLGGGDDPNHAPLLQACNDPKTCRLLGTAAAVADRDGGTGCFVYGVGSGVAALGPSLGLLGSCGSGPSFKLEVPPTFASLVIPPVFSFAGVAGFPSIASLSSVDGQLLVGSPNLHIAWLHAQDATPPLVMTAPPDADHTFGLTVAAVGPAPSLTVAVAAPGAGAVYLFDVEQGSASLRACVARASPYGVVMHGFVDGTKRQLAISDGARRVEVLDLDALLSAGAGAGGAPAGPASVVCAPPPASAVKHTFGCTVTDDVFGCNGAAFGYSLATGDLDGDGDLELAVGAPGLNVRKVINGGAVQVFNLEGSDAPVETLFLASAEAEDRLGSQLVTLHFGARDVVASNAFGKQEVPIFYCPTFAPGGFARCQ